MSLGASNSFDSMSNFPAGFAQGIIVQGLPVLNAQGGRVFWLDSTNGSDGNHGNFARPFATLPGALRNMASNMPSTYGDVLMVKQGHFERVSSPTSHVVNLSGVQIIGLGTGDDRPTWVFDTAASSVITINGSQVSFQNCRFVANFANIARVFNPNVVTSTGSFSGNTLNVTAVTAGSFQPGQTVISSVAGLIPGTKIVSQSSGVPGGVGVYVTNKTQTVASGSVTAVSRNFSVRGCEVTDTSAALNFLSVVGITNAASNGSDGVSLIGNNIFLLAAAGNVTLLTATGHVDRAVVANNNFRSRTVGASALIVPAAGRLLTNLTVVDNIFDTVGAAGTATGLLITTDQTTNSGVIARNFIKNLATAPILCTANAGFIWSENYYASAADKSGAVLPGP